MFWGILCFAVGMFVGATVIAFVQGADQQEEEKEWMDYVKKFQERGGGG